MARSLRCNSCGAQPCICPTPTAGLTRALSAALAAADSDEGSRDEQCPTCLAYEVAASDPGRVAELEEDLDSLEASRSALAEQVQELKGQLSRIVDGGDATVHQAQEFAEAAAKERDELAAELAECIEQLEQISALAGVPFEADSPGSFARDLRGAVAGAVYLADARPAHSLEAARLALAEQVQTLACERDELAAVRNGCIKQLEQLSALAVVPFDTAAPERFAVDLRDALAARSSLAHPPDPHDGPPGFDVIGGVGRG